MYIHISRAVSASASAQAAPGAPPPPPWRAAPRRGSRGGEFSLIAFQMISYSTFDIPFWMILTINIAPKKRC